VLLLVFSIRVLKTSIRYASNCPSAPASTNIVSRTRQASSMMHGSQILLLRNPGHQVRIVPLRVKFHLLFLVLCLNSLLHPRLPNRSRNHRHRHRLHLDRQARMCTAIIPVTHTTPSPLKIKVFHLHQFPNRTHRVRMGSSERMAMERMLVKLRSWSHRRSDLDTAASAVRRTVRARADACTVTNHARTAGRGIVRGGIAGARTRCARRRGIRCLYGGFIHEKLRCE
jgi:hypothetical protein